jgi:hypothetical protein
MHGHDLLRLKETDCFCGVFRPHNEMLTNRETSQIDRSVLRDQSHVRKQSRVPCVVKGLPFSFQQDTGSFAQIQWTVILADEGGTMKRDREFDRAKRELAPSPVIHWHDFHVLTSQPRGKLKRGDDGGSRTLGDRN